jgi:branched-chain amino acid transport system ATP-binding protein
MRSDAPVLSVEDLRVSYGPIKAIRGCSLQVNAGETVAVVGANGAGKTTLLRAISQTLPIEAGEVLFRGETVRGRRTHALARGGMLHVPEGRGVLPSLTVWENLRIAWEIRPARAAFEDALERAYLTFPRLKERLRQAAGTMSGGEQQMLALARAIVNPPELLLVDEPSLGLSPLLVGEAYRALRRFQEAGMTILLVEQNVQIALRFAQRAYVLKQGEIVAQGGGAELLRDPAILEHYLGSTVN